MAIPSELGSPRWKDETTGPRAGQRQRTTELEKELFATVVSGFVNVFERESDGFLTLVVRVEGVDLEEGGTTVLDPVEVIAGKWSVRKSSV